MVIYKNILVDKAKELIKKGDFCILDVRAEEERKRGYIDKSIHIALKDLLQRSFELPKNNPILIYCSLGIRSAHACFLLNKLEFKNLYNLVGGFKMWRNYTHDK